MDSNTNFRVEDLTEAYTKISTTEEAFILSRLTANWTSGSTLFSECPSFDENKFYNLMRVLVKKGAVECDAPKKRTVQTQQEQDLTRPVERRYPRLDIPELVLKRKPEALAAECIDEIIFLSHYGDGLDFYRRLGLQDNPFECSTSDVREKTIKFNTFFTQIRKKYPRYTEIIEHIDAAEKAINAAKVLLDKELRAAYNQKLKNKGAYASLNDKEEVARDVLHYNAALKFIEERKHNNAMNEIKLARHLESKNHDYIILEKKILCLQNKDSAKVLLITLERNETLLWDERVMKQTLSELFALDDSADMHIDVARVLANKNAFQTAIEILNEIEKVDDKTQEEIDALGDDIKKRYKIYKNKF